jgi:hypothetical protein
MIGLAGAVCLTSCSSTPSASSTTSSTAASASTTTTTSPNRGDQPICSLVEPSLIESSLDTVVGQAHATVRGSTTTCTYVGANPSQTVIIGYNTSATSSTFESDKSSIAARASSTIDLPQYGSTAYAATVSSGGETVNTVVVFRAALQVTIVAAHSANAVENLMTSLLTTLQNSGPSTTTSTTTTAT